MRQLAQWKRPAYEIQALLLMLGVFLAGPSPAVARNIGCGHYTCYAQSWDCRSDWCWKELRGKIIKIKYNTGVVADDDLNIFITPDGEFSYTAINREGNQNQAHDDIPNGAIECELRTIITNKMNELFPDFTRVTAGGWWVEDSAHDNKTELHPLKYMYGPVDEYGRLGSSFSVFVGQDTSGRFDVTDNTVNLSFSIPMPTESDVLELNKETGRKAMAGTVRENMMVELQGIYSYYNNRVDLGAFRFDITAGIEDGYESFYLARIDISTEPIFNDHVTYELRQELGAGKRLEITIEPQFLIVGNMFEYQAWELTSNTGAVQGSPEYYSSRPRFVVAYAPSENKHDYSWRLFGKARSDYSSITNSADSGLQLFGYAQKIREYRLEPSNITIGAIYPRQPPRENPPPVDYPDRPSCYSPEGVRATEYILPLVNMVPGSFTWWIRIEKGQSTTAGTRHLGSTRVIAAVKEELRTMARTSRLETTRLPSQDRFWTWTKVTREEPFVYQSFKAYIDSSDDHIMRFDYGSGGMFPVSVRVTGETDLGEKLETTAQVIRLCTQNETPAEGFIESILKSTAALEKLRQLGLLPSEPTVDPIELEALFERAGKVSLQIGEPYKIIKRLPGEYGKAATNFFKWLDGYTLTAQEAKQLGLLAEAAKKIQWASPPPADAFEKIAQSAVFTTMKGPGALQGPPKRALPGKPGTGLSEPDGKKGERPTPHR